MMNHLTFKPTDRLMLDVGVGTGKPLKTIANSFPDDLKVVGVDINPGYV
jgi:ubiquinone/menaquinone biosynthesis C-methylase UbiE